MAGFPCSLTSGEMAQLKVDVRTASQVNGSRCGPRIFTGTAESPGEVQPWCLNISFDLASDKETARVGTTKQQEDKDASRSRTKAPLLYSAAQNSRPDMNMILRTSIQHQKRLCNSLRCANHSFSSIMNLALRMQREGHAALIRRIQ